MRGDGFTLESLSSADAVYLPQLNQALAEAKSRSGLTMAGQFTVRSFASTPAFRDATLAPGWVAAFTEGDWIGTQPLRTLAGRKLLVSVLRHEFLHALVEGHAGANAPLWLREGLVDAWNGEAPANTQPPALKLGEVDRALAHSTTETQSAAAHCAAAWYVARVLSRYRRDQVIGWLRSGVPSQAAEKGLLFDKMSEEHTSGAKALVDLIGILPGINPRPTARTSFSAACSGALVALP
jgi:stage II sporulation protein D